MAERKNRESTFQLYTGRSSLKWIVLVISVLISAGSVIYTNELVDQIRQREKKQIDLYANTLQYIANENDAVNLVLILEKIIQANSTIPVILTDQNDNPEFYRNLPKADQINEQKQRKKYLSQEIASMKAEREPIIITLHDEDNKVYGYKYIYYKNSSLLTQLRYYPYIQLSVIAIFGLITFAIFNYSRTAEQNRVWVGLAKETAHQLGTPLSSLMAWVEYFKETYPNDTEVFQELSKDVERLGMITERFSNIGSVPQLKTEQLLDTTLEVIRYLERRISTKVKIEISAFPHTNIAAPLNRALFAWVIENLIKNAVDAMEGKGSIKIRILKVNEGNIAIDISDSGKGLSKSKVDEIFKPGYSTKKRGWGLGLTLAKRIIENYHGGKIFVKETEINKGTTFRILLKSS